MNRLQQVAMGAVLSAGIAAGCTTHNETVPFNPEAAAPLQAESSNDQLSMAHSEGATPNNDATPVWEAVDPQETAPIVTSAAAYTKLFQQDAPIQIIFVPTTADADYSQNFLEMHPDAFFGEDPGYLREMTLHVAAATGLRYVPDSITAVQTPELALDKDCFEAADAEIEYDMREHVAPFAKAGQINLIILEAENCDGTTGGYSSPGNWPLVHLSSLYDDSEAFTDTVLHEAGHSAGLEHANAVVCNDPIQSEDCNTLARQDEGSLMSYTNNSNANDFSTAELLDLGLLDNFEVLHQPAPGFYELGDALTTTDGTDTISALTFDGEKGRVVISWEKDAEAAFNEDCLEMTPDSNYQAPKVEYKVIDRVDQEGFTHFFLCTGENKPMLDHSVQVRLKTENNEENLITRPDRAPAGDSVIPSIGEVAEGATVYRDDHSVVIFEGVDDSNRAIIQVIGL